MKNFTLFLAIIFSATFVYAQDAQPASGEEAVSSSSKSKRTLLREQRARMRMDAQMNNPEYQQRHQIEVERLKALEEERAKASAAIQKKIALLQAGANPEDVFGAQPDSENPEGITASELQEAQSSQEKLEEMSTEDLTAVKISQKIGNKKYSATTTKGAVAKILERDGKIDLSRSDLGFEVSVEDL